MAKQTRTVTIKEKREEGRTWTSNHRTETDDEAKYACICKHFGSRAGLFFTNGHLEVVSFDRHGVGWSETLDIEITVANKGKP